MSAAAPDLTAVQRATAWAAKKALPLWATAGFERKTGLFHERLTFEGAPIELPARRLMVHARQIATYCRAMAAGIYTPEFSIETSLAVMARHYRSSDDAPGWVFSIGPDLRPADRTRDLYAHAFVLYALAWCYRLTGETYILRMADELLDVLDRQFALADGSFADAIPAKDNLRRQNPHMHLLEALLAMAEASTLSRYMDRARSLATFATSRFLELQTGLLLEEFTSGWDPGEAFGSNRVEPGHLCEWAWLLGEYERLGGDSFGAHISRFLRFTNEYGTDSITGLIFDAVSETGTVIDASFRCWPHTEAIKAFTRAALNGNAGKAGIAHHFLDRLFAVFLPDNLNGGWVDRVDKYAKPLIDHMPASSLYHVIGAILVSPSSEAPTEYRQNGIGR